MTGERTKYEEYLICQERGHIASSVVTASMPPQNICSKCGTYYWYTQPELCEGMNKPEPPEAPWNRISMAAWAETPCVLSDNQTKHGQHLWRRESNDWKQNYFSIDDIRKCPGYPIGYEEVVDYA